MWLLTIFSTFLVHAMLMTGVILLACSMFLGAIAFFRTYKFPMQILGFILLGAGLYYEGALAHMASQEKAVAALEMKLKAAEVESLRLNGIIITQKHDYDILAQTKGDNIVKYIHDRSTVIDSKCVITPDVIDALNQAASLDTTTAPKKDKP
jgi:hypothetical protein